MIRRGLIAAITMIACAGASAQVKVSVSLDRSRIYLGERATLRVDVEGVREVDPPQIDIPGVEVTYLGGSGRSSTSVTIINGRMQRIENFGFAMRFDLRPTRPGDITIPPLEIRHAGRTYNSRPLILRVIKLPDQEYVILEQEATPTEVYVDQKLKLTLRVYLRKLSGRFAEVDPIFPRDIPHLTIPWFAGLEDWQTSDVNEFAKPLMGNPGEPAFAINNYVQQQFFDQWPIPFKLPRTSVERTCKDGKKRAYFCYTLEKEFRPTASGAYEVPAVSFKGTIPVVIGPSGRATRQEKIIASSRSLRINVRPVPAEGRPESFSGAVGRYTLEVDATPKAAKVGDPIDLILSITGDGVLEKILAPDLSKQTELNKYFRVHTDAPAVKITDNTKTFRYTIRAKDEKVEAVPPISFSYFDVDTGRFKTIYSKPVTVSISPTATMSLSEVVETAAARSHSRLGAELEEGLLADFTGEGVLANQEFDWRPSPGLGVVLLLPPIAYVVSLITHRRLSRLRTDVAFVRSRAARKHALGRLKNLDRRGTRVPSAEFCGELSKVLTCYIADKLSLPREGLTTADVGRHLARRNVRPDLADSINELIRRCDDGRFGAPGTEPDRAAMMLGARDLLARLEKEL